MDISELIGMVKEKYNPQKMEGVSATYQFRLTGEKERALYIVVEEGEATFCEGEAQDPDTTVSLSWENLQKILSRELNVATAFLTRKIRVEGNMSLAMKLQGLFS